MPGFFWVSESSHARTLLRFWFFRLPNHLLRYAKVRVPLTEPMDPPRSARSSENLLGASGGGSSLSLSEQFEKDLLKSSSSSSSNYEAVSIDEPVKEMYTLGQM